MAPASRSGPHGARRPCRHAGLLAAALVSVLPAVSAGCRFSLARVRRGAPLDRDAYERLEPGATTRSEALEALGAPEDVEWEHGRSRLTWEYQDRTVFNARAQVPISLVFGYRHDVFRFFDNRAETSVMELVFDEEGRLEEKGLRLPAGYREDRDSDTPAEGGKTWRARIAARGEHAFFVYGDADVADWDRVVEPGPGVGLDLGVQPVPPVTVSLGGRASRHPGRSLRLGDGRRADFDDLELYTFEALVRVQLPVRALLGDEPLRALFFAEDPARHDGWTLWVEGGLGGTWNGNQPVSIDGARDGDFVSAGPVFTNTASGGIEYGTPFFGLRVGLVWRRHDAFDEGDAGIANDVEGLQSLGGMATLEVKF